MKQGAGKRWDEITGCPATWIGARFLRRMAIEHGWAEPQPKPEKGGEADLLALDPEPGGKRPPAPEPETAREMFGPPSLADLSVVDLAALDGIIFGKIVKAKADTA